MKTRELLLENGFKQLHEFENLFYENIDQIKYSDGSVELEILETLKTISGTNINRNDILEDSIKNWPTEYHFSWVRQNILKPINFSKSDRVLELGGGTGVLTESIAKSVNEIVAIEGTEIRAKSIFYRCSRFNNVQIVLGNFLEIDLIKIFGKESFDKICLIGVLEYVKKYSPDEILNPVEYILNICNKLLKPDGELIIAIENKIGLKYLLGYEEDHLNIPHYGTQSLYKARGISTYSREILLDILKHSGYVSNQFYYPFPDYKLPKVIIKDEEEIDNEKKKLYSTLLNDIKFRNYSNNTVPLVNEGKVLENFIKDGSFKNISNSFLISSRKEITPVVKENDPFLFYFAITRKYKFSNEISFFKKGQTIYKAKTWYGNKTNQDNMIFLDKEGTFTEKVIDGQTVHQILYDYYLIDDRSAYMQELKGWVNYLRNKIVEMEGYTYDLLPTNTLKTQSGELIIFDFQEWKSNNELTVEQLIYRYFKFNSNVLEWLYPNNEDIWDNNLSPLITELNLKDLKFFEIECLNKIESYAQSNILLKPYNTKKVFIDNKEKDLKSYFKLFLPPILLRIRQKIHRRKK